MKNKIEGTPILKPAMVKRLQVNKNSSTCQKKRQRIRLSIRYRNFVKSLKIRQNKSLNRQKNSSKNLSKNSSNDSETKERKCGKKTRE